MQICGYGVCPAVTQQEDMTRFAHQFYRLLDFIAGHRIFEMTQCITICFGEAGEQFIALPTLLAANELNTIAVVTGVLQLYFFNDLLDFVKTTEIQGGSKTDKR